MIRDNNHFMKLSTRFYKVLCKVCKCIIHILNTPNSGSINHEENTIVQAILRKKGLEFALSGRCCSQWKSAGIWGCRNSMGARIGQELRGRRKSWVCGGRVLYYILYYIISYHYTYIYHCIRHLRRRGNLFPGCSSKESEGKRLLVIPVLCSETKDYLKSMKKNSGFYKNWFFFPQWEEFENIGANYWWAVRILMYLATLLTHWREIIHLMRYLSGTRNYGILLDRSFSVSKIKVYLDSDWENDVGDCHFYLGYILKFNGSLLSSSAKKLAQLPAVDMQKVPGSF
ncbi:uncharacterized protein VP01_5467g2, partial [Puccinia sorghi]